MPKLPRIPSREVIRALKRLGFEQVRQTGSHVVMKKKTEEGEIGCVVPIHQELKVGTLSSILKQAQITVNHSLRILADQSTLLYNAKARVIGIKQSKWIFTPLFCAKVESIGLPYAWKMEL